MAQTVLAHLGRPTISWCELTDWEAETCRQLVRELEGVPVFVVRLLDTILAQTVSTARRSPSNDHDHMEIN